MVITSTSEWAVLPTSSPYSISIPIRAAPMRCEALRLPDPRSGYICQPNFHISPSISTFRLRRGGAAPFHISDFLYDIICGLADCHPYPHLTRTHVDVVCKVHLRRRLQQAISTMTCAPIQTKFHITALWMRFLIRFVGKCFPRLL